MVEGALEGEELGFALDDVVVLPVLLLLAVVEAWLLVEVETCEPEALPLKLLLPPEEGDDGPELDLFVLAEGSEVLEPPPSVDDPLLAEEELEVEGTFKVCPMLNLSQSNPGFAPFKALKVHPIF